MKCRWPVLRSRPITSPSLTNTVAGEDRGLILQTLATLDMSEPDRFGMVSLSGHLHGEGGAAVIRALLRLEAAAPPGRRVVTGASYVIRPQPSGDTTP